MLSGCRFREGVPLDLSKDYSHLTTPRKHYIQERVRSIEKEVDHASKVQKSLEMGSIEDRERLVRSLTSTSQPSGEMGSAESEDQSHPPSVTARQHPQTTGERRPHSLRQQRRPDLPPWASPDDYD